MNYAYDTYVKVWDTTSPYINVIASFLIALHLDYFLTLHLDESGPLLAGEYHDLVFGGDDPHLWPSTTVGHKPNIWKSDTMLPDWPFSISCLDLDNSSTSNTNRKQDKVLSGGKASYYCCDKIQIHKQLKLTFNQSNNSCKTLAKLEKTSLVQEYPLQYLISNDYHIYINHCKKLGKFISFFTT